MTTNQRRAERMGDIADDLAAVEKVLRLLQVEAEVYNLHRAAERIERMRDAATTTAKGLRIQAAKLAAKSHDD